jgi:DNA-binding transcriptional LysR family regulator
MAFTLAQFRLVLAVHEHGSLGKVAQAFGVTQPALSRSLKELERQLGAQLFERHPSGLRATSSCLAILPYAANATEEAARALEEIRIFAGESRKVLRIGAISSAATSLLPPLIERLMVDMPGICMKIVEGVDEILVQGLLSHDLDIIICGTSQENDEIAKALDLGLGDICTLLVGADHPLVGRTNVSIAEILDQPWAALPRDSILRTFCDQLVRAQGMPAPNVLVETRSISIIRRLVAEQSYITWGPAPLYTSGDRDSDIVMLDLPQFQLQRSFFAYRLRHATMSGTVRHALTILRRLALDLLTGNLKRVGRF